jgi:hypothetical protein
MNRRPPSVPRRRPNSAAAIVLFLIAAGCSRGPGYEAGAVSGTVTIDNQPVAKGYVTFNPVEKGPVCGAAIAEGKYRCEQVPTGKHKAILQAEAAQPTKVYDVVNKTQREVPTPIVLPPKYQSGIEMEVKPGENVQDFNVQTRP